jgi:NADPH:quinone reductase-like Zn-dependent oxidoreductase
MRAVVLDRFGGPELAALLADGALRPVISHELPQSEAAEAHRIQEQGHPSGKIVLIVAG